MNSLREQLLRDESVRLKPYLDCCGKYWRECSCVQKGKLTIGTGRNLDDKGISMAENDFMLDNDIPEFTAAVLARIPWAISLDEARREVLINMSLNMGIKGLLGFRNFLSYLKDGSYAAAAEEMLHSKWAEQVGPRAERLAEQIRSGVRQ